MKKLLLLFGIVSCWLSTKGQTCPPANALPTPYYENFDTIPGGETGTYSNCWKATTTSDPNWESESSGTANSSSTGPLNDYSGTGIYVYMEVSSGSLGDTAGLISPTISLTNLTTPELSFYYHMYGATMGTLAVEIWDGTGWTEEWTLSGEQQTSDTDPWRYATVDLSSYSGNIKIKFLGTKGSSFTGDMSIDEVSVAEAPPCTFPFPGHLTASNISSGGADLSWDTSNAATSGYEVLYGLSGFDPATGGSSVTTSTESVSLSGLSSNSDYDFYVIADCGATNGKSDTAGPGSFTTLCAPFTAAYSTGFESDALDLPPSCWDEYHTNSGAWVEVEDFTGTAAPYAGTQALYMYSSSGSAADTLLAVSPKFSDMTAGDKQVRFYANSDGPASQLYVGTTADSTGSGAVNYLDTITFPVADTYQEVVVALNASNGYNGTDTYVVLAHSNGTTYQYVRIDDFNYEVIPPCSKPTGLSVTGVTTNSFTIDFNGTAPAYNVEWGPSGFVQGTGCTDTITSTVATLDNNSAPGCMVTLAPNTLYDVYVRSDCSSNNDGTSIWEGPVTFRTACAASTAPYSMDFENEAQDAPPLCWKHYQTNSFSFVEVEDFTGTAAPYAGTQALYLYASSASAASDSLYAITPRLSDLTDGDKRVNLFANSDGPNADLIIGTADTNAGTINFNPIDTINFAAADTYEQIVVNITAANGYNGTDDYIVLAHSLGQTYQYVRIDNFKYEEIPACAPPLVSSLGVYGVGSSDAWAYWGSGSQGIKTYVEVGAVGFTPGTQNYIQLDSTAGSNDTLQITGLSGNTDYEFYIQDSCQPGGLSNWIGPISFKTNCSLSPATLPFSDGFETYNGPVTTDGPFQCGTSYGWSIDRPGGTGELSFVYTPSSGPSAPLTGSQSAGLTSLSSTSPIYLTLTIDLSNYTTSPGIGLTFAYADHLDEPNDDDRVWARGSVTDPWVEIFDWSTVNSSTWDTVNLDLKLTLQAAGQAISSSTQIRWGQEDNASMTGGDGFSIDDVKLEVVACPDPAVLQAVGLIDTAATLDWTGSAASTSYEVWFGPQSFYQGTQTNAGARSFVTSDSLLVDTLSENTCYEFLVRAVCGAGDTSAWIGPVAFCTPCSPKMAPYTEDFFGSSLPTCWDAYETTGDGWRFTGTPGYAAATAGDHTGNGGNFAWVDFSSTDAGVVLETPLVDVSNLTTAALFFSHFSMNTNDFTSYNDLFVEAYNGNSWVQVDSLRGDLGGWVDFYYDISSYVFNGNLVKVRFRAEQGTGTYFYNDLLVDDVSIDEMLTCFQATNLASTGVTTTTIDLSWTSGGASNWQIEYGPAGFTPGSGTMVAVGSNPYTLTGLTPATVYDIYLRDSCGVGDVGWWSTPITVQTNCVTMLNGTYTVGGPVGPNNFATLDSAVTTLNLCGVTGPVVLNLSGGTHNAVMLEDIPGASSTNTVTINGSLLGDSIITTSATAALDLNATAYVNFNRLYIENVFGNFAVRLHDQAHHISIDSCYMMVDTNTTSSSRAVIAGTDSETSAFTAGDNADHISITNSVIRGGYYGLSVYGFSSTAHNSNITVNNNLFTDQYYYGLRTYYMDSVEISGNHIDGFRNTASYGIQVYYADLVTISENVMPDIGTYALYLYYINRDVTSAALTSNIVNNIAHGGNGGLYTYGSAYMNIYHNTLQGSTYGMYLSGSTLYSYTNFDIRNNIIINDGTGRAMYIGTVPGSLTLDYNLYYAPTGDIAYQGATYNTLAAWVAGVSGQNANSVEGDPLFVGANDFHVIGNLADDAGDNTVGVTIDVDGDTRPASGSTTVDIGADEFTAVSGDLALVGGDFIKGLCLTNTDSIVLYVENIIGATVDFSNDPLTAHWTVSGPMNSNGTITLNSGTAAVNDSALLYGQNVDLSVPGTYTLTAYLDTNAVNTLVINDTLLSVDFEVRPEFVASPDTVILSTPGDSAQICIESSFFGGGEFFISEICHFAGATNGAPVGGTPSWLAADDYIEITGVPGSDLGGITLEQWGTTSLTNSYTFPQGTVLSPNGTAVIAVGSASGSPSPANYFYFADVSAGHSSGSTQGRILKDASGAIIDAVGYGPSSYTFPASAGVGSEWTGGQPSSTSTWGIRLEGADVNSGTNWVSSATSPQDPNTVNSGVTVPAGIAPAGFSWSVNGSVVDTVPCTYVGPLSTPGTFNYIATFSNSCGSYSDTVVVIVPSCFAPANFNGSSLSDSSVAITWDSTGTGASSFEVQYGPAGFSPGTGTSVTVNGDSAAVSGLVNNLCQDFYIRSSCGATSGSGWIGPVNICPEAIACDDLEPYNPGGILGQSALFVGWYGTTAGNASVDTTQASGGNQSLYIPADNGTTDIVAWFDTISSGAWNFKFDIYVPSGTNAYYNFQRNYTHGLGGINSWAFDINYLANGTASVDGGSYGGNGIATFNYNPGQWNTIEHIIDFDNDTAFIMVNGNMTNAGWTYSFGNLSVPIQLNGINFYSTTTLSNADYYIDEFCVSPYLAAGCPDPTNLALDTAACDSAVVSWSSAAGAASLIEYGPVGFVPGTGTMVAMVNSPYSITGLVPGTNYEFYVADTCAGGDTSDFVGPVSFTTLSGPVAAISHTLGMPTDSNLVVSFDASGSSNGSSYSWDFGDGSTGSGITTSHPYDSNGTYVVVLTVTGVCGTDTISDTVIVEGVSLEGSMIERSLNLYPNPATDQVQLSFYSETTTGVQISLWSVNGEKLRNINQVNRSGTRVEATIDLSAFAGGVYLIRLESGDGIVVRRLIVE